MAINIALLGAGGNMGRRITRSLKDDSRYELRLIEPSARGRELLADLGCSATDLDEAVAGADVVVFAVPDKIMQGIAADVIPRLDAGTSILFLDPAAVAAGRIPRREDIQCYVTHPTHPPLYDLLEEPEVAARHDYWGGGLAHQAVVFATAWGDEEHADQVEQVVVDMFAPISRTHRITVQQMAMLEPALTETLTNGCIAVIREGMERVIAAGVPEEATFDFLMGHFQIGIALIFERFDWRLSDGAQMALAQSREMLFKDDWYRIFDDEELMASLRRITGGE